MSTGALAAAAGAAAVYYWTKGCGAPEGEAVWETHRGVHSAPTGWRDNLFFFAEGLRYTYSETLGRWRTADLLIGLAYLSRKESQEHAAADIAAQARPLGEGMSLAQLDAAMAELQVIERFMRYCFVMRERKLQAQREMFGALGIGEGDILMHEVSAGVLKPSFVLVRDTTLRAVVLSIRGTHSFKDMFTSLTGASKPHHLFDSNGVVLGYAHLGMLAAARWVKSQTLGPMEAALAENAGYSLRIVGHSLGGGTAALLTMMLRERGGPFGGATCLALACPSCMTLELARSCSDYVTTLVNGADVIPCVSPGAADGLREEVTRSSWSLEFRRDLRSSSVVRAVESGLRGVGSATWTATSWTTQKLSACYPRRRAVPGRTLKRRNSDDWTDRADDRSAKQPQGAGSQYGIASAAEEALLAAAGGQQQHQQQGEGPRSPTLAAMERATQASVLGMLGAGASSAHDDGSRAASPPPPAGLCGSSRTQHGHHHHGGDGQQRGAVWGRRLVGWSQQVGALTGRGALALGTGLSSGSRLAVRSTSGLLSRVWLQSCRPPTASNGGEQLPTGSSQGAEQGEQPAFDPPTSPRMEEECGGQDAGAEEAAAVAAALDDADSAALARELSLRMCEVEAAVEDAEAEEAAGGGDATVPSVIRPGQYGGGTASPTRRQAFSPSKQQDARWRRTMYPAGRILHLVPAELLDPPAAPASPTSSSGTGDSGSSRRSSSDYGEDTFMEPPCSASPSTPRCGTQQQQQQWESVQLSPSPQRPAATQQRAQRRHRRVSCLGLQDMMAGEEALVGCTRTDGAASSPGGGAAPGSEDGVWVHRCDSARSGASEAATGPAPGEAVLLDWVPQTAYGRIKLCPRMLADHFIPSYLAAMESAQRALQERRAALAAAEQEAAASGGADVEMQST